MPSRQSAHPLNRWAPVSEYQSEPCERFAVVLADPDSHHLDTVYETISAYSKSVCQTAYRNKMQSAESTEIELISWKKALAAELRKHDHRSPDATARNVYELGLTLHQWPLHLGQSSILRCVTIAGRAYDGQIRLGHLERICVILRSHDHGMTVEEHQAQYDWNQRKTGELISLAVQENLSPKQLEIHIARLQGKPTAGRPRRR